MTSDDPETIQRILFLTSSVHVYTIPPLTSTKGGYKSADWTTPDPRNGNKTRQIFTARLRILETSHDVDPEESESGSAAAGAGAGAGKVKIDILLEDPSTGELFAAAPYTDPASVEQVLDSSRFFVVRVVSGDGRKAMLGIGFEERGAAFDFLVGLEEGRKVLGFDTGDGEKGGGGKKEKAEERDYSLKPGERIKVDIGKGGVGRVARREDDVKSPGTEKREEERALFSIAPPPGSSSSSSIGGVGEDAFRIPPPPPSSSSSSGGGDVGGNGRRRRPQSGVISPEVLKAREREVEERKKAEKELGFDDGEFGEFQ